MSEVQTLVELGKFAGSLTVTGLLLMGIWLIITGRLKTDGHHSEVVDNLKDSERRGWDAASEARKELAEVNKVNDKLADSLEELTRTITGNSRGGQR